MDTIEQTIEKLLTTIKNLSELTDKAINNVDSVACQAVCRREFDDIMEKHHNQY